MAYYNALILILNDKKYLFISSLVHSSHQSQKYYVCKVILEHLKIWIHYVHVKMQKKKKMLKNHIISVIILTGLIQNIAQDHYG